MISGHLGYILHNDVMENRNATCIGCSSPFQEDFHPSYLQLAVFSSGFIPVIARPRLSVSACSSFHAVAACSVSCASAEDSFLPAKTAG